MRTWMSLPFLSLLGLVIVGSAGCGASPAVSVVRVPQGEQPESIRGDVVKLRRGSQDAYAGARGGFHVVRSHEDWHGAWRSDMEPAMPSTLDTNKQMLVLAVAEGKDVREIKIQRAVETAEFIYVWVRETTIGEKCNARNLEHAPYDAVVATRADKPVKFFVESDRADSCGDAPTARVECHLTTSQAAWSSTVSAQPGETVECELTSTANGRFEVVDRVLSLSDQPPGSSAKLAFTRGPTRGSVALDVYGTYGIRAEVVDESGRRSLATATVEAKPPRTKDVLVQLVWGNFDARDEADTFPRVTLRVAETGGKGQRCTAEIPVPGLCEARQQGAYTFMKIPAGSRHLPVSVLYLDERIEKGPGACVHVWFDGQRTAEICDRKHRDAEERWELGVLDTSTGKLGEAGQSPDPSGVTATKK